MEIMLISVHDKVNENYGSYKKMLPVEMIINLLVHLLSSRTLPASQLHHVSVMRFAGTVQLAVQLLLVL